MTKFTLLYLSRTVILLPLRTASDPSVSCSGLHLALEGSQKHLQLPGSLGSVPGHPDQIRYILPWAETTSNLAPRDEGLYVPNGQGGQALVIAKKTL